MHSQTQTIIECFQASEQVNQKEGFRVLDINDWQWKCAWLGSVIFQAAKMSESRTLIQAPFSYGKRGHIPELLQGTRTYFNELCSI